jgi:hypothetical protein
MRGSFSFSNCTSYLVSSVETLSNPSRLIDASRSRFVSKDRKRNGEFVRFKAPNSVSIGSSKPSIERQQR